MCLHQGFDTELLNFVTVYLLSTLSKTPANVFETSTFWFYFCCYGYCSWQLLYNSLFPLYCFMGFLLSLSQVLTMTKGYHSGTENIKILGFVGK